MATFALSLLVLLLSLAGLGIGLLTGRGPPRGSCGGLACQKKLECAACPHHATHQPAVDRAAVDRAAADHAAQQHFPTHPPTQEPTP